MSGNAPEPNKSKETGAMPIGAEEDAEDAEETEDTEKEEEGDTTDDDEEEEEEERAETMALHEEEAARAAEEAGAGEGGAASEVGRPTKAVSLTVICRGWSRSSLTGMKPTSDTEGMEKGSRQSESTASATTEVESRSL